MGFWTDVSNFAVGAIEQDKANTKERFAIRAEELQANRASLLKKKEKRYEKDIENFYKEKEKFKTIESANAAYADDKNATQYAAKILPLTTPNWKDLPEKMKINMINNYDGKTIDYKMTGTLDEIDQNAAMAEKAITRYTSSALDDARGDRFLINKILGIKKKSDTEIDEQMSSVLKAKNAVNLTETSVNQKNVGLDVKNEGGLYGNIDKTSETYKFFRGKNFSSFEKLEKQSSDYKSANNNLTIGKIAKELNIPNQADYFVLDRDKNITRFKGGGSEFAKTTASALKMYKDYAGSGNSTDALFVFYNGDANKLVTHYAKDNTDGLLANRIKELGTAVTNGAVLGEGGSFTNVLRKESNVIIVPTGNTVNFDNSIIGTNVVIPENDRRKVSNLYTKVLIGMATDKDGVNVQKLKEINNNLQNLKYGQQNQTLNTVNNLFLASLIDNNIITKGEALENKVFNSGYNNPKNEEFKTAIDNLGTAKPEEKSETGNVQGSIKVTFSDGKTKTLPNTETVRKELEKDKENIINQEVVQPIKQEEKIIDNIKTETVTQKKTPADFGEVNKPVFETREEVLRLLPYPMTGKEIKQMYAIDNTTVKFNDFTKFSPIS
jgi:hypothetical protein